MPENLETINNYLRDTFGIDTDSSQPMYRVVFSDEQFEKRETKYTDSGIELLHPEVRLLPKYSWLDGVYVLEYLTIVPDQNLKELAASKKSYEPLWAFVDKHGNRMMPAIMPCKFVIDLIQAARGKQSMAKYKDPLMEAKNQKEVLEIRKAEIDKLHNELFGDESSLAGDTVNASGSSIIMPSNYNKSVH